MDHVFKAIVLRQNITDMGPKMPGYAVLRNKMWVVKSRFMQNNRGECSGFSAATHHDFADPFADPFVEHDAGQDTLFAQLRDDLSATFPAKL